MGKVLDLIEKDARPGAGKGGFCLPRHGHGEHPVETAMGEADGQAGKALGALASLTSLFTMVFSRVKPMAIISAVCSGE